MTIPTTRQAEAAESPTAPADTPTAPRGFAYCSWHRGYSDTARMVRIIEAGSGPSHGLFACEPCRKVHGLVPVADQP